MERYGVKYHFYADQAQVNISLDRDNESHFSSLKNLEHYFADIRIHFDENKQMLSLWLHRIILNPNTFEHHISVFRGFVTSRREYCTSLYISDCNINHLQRIPIIEAPIQINTRKCDHITLIRLKLHWLLFRQCIHVNILLRMYKSTNAMAPECLYKFESIR